MAKKAETVSMIDTFKDFKDSQSIDRTTLVSVMEESFRSVIAKIFVQHRQTLIVAFGSDVKDVEILHWKLILSKTCHGDDTMAEDILRRFLALFGIIPENMQPFRLDPLDGEYLTAVAEGHKDGRDKRHMPRGQLKPMGHNH